MSDSDDDVPLSGRTRVAVEAPIKPSAELKTVSTVRVSPRMSSISVDAACQKAYCFDDIESNLGCNMTHEMLKVYSRDAISD